MYSLYFIIVISLVLSISIVFLSKRERSTLEDVLFGILLILAGLAFNMAPLHNASNILPVIGTIIILSGLFLGVFAYFFNKK